MQPATAFEVLPGGGSPSPVVVHVPHAGTIIPNEVRVRLLPDDAALATEVLRLTDHRTDVLAAGASRHGATRFVNRLSRLVIDPERLPDEREELAAHGMGAVYTRGHDRRPLRQEPPPDEATLLQRYFHPYAAAFSGLVDRQLRAHGRCTVVDLHSYPSRKLPYELGTGPRPKVCVGTDPFHTPPWLSELVTAATDAHGLDTAYDTPFAGTYVPLDRLHRDERVTSVMLEIRRDTYLDEEVAEPHGGETLVAAFVTDVVAALEAHHRAGH